VYLKYGPTIIYFNYVLYNLYFSKKHNQGLLNALISSRVRNRKVKGLGRRSFGLCILWIQFGACVIGSWWN
jgi:hypothetical protein